MVRCVASFERALAPRGLEHQHEVDRGGEAQLRAPLGRQVAQRDRDVGLAHARGPEPHRVLGPRSTKARLASSGIRFLGAPVAKAKAKPSSVSIAGKPATRAALSRDRTRRASTRAAQHRLEEVAERGVLGDGGLGRGGPCPTDRPEPQLDAELGDAGVLQLAHQPAPAWASASWTDSGCCRPTIGRRGGRRFSSSRDLSPALGGGHEPLAPRARSRAARPAPRPWCHAPARWPPREATARRRRWRPGHRPSPGPAPGGWRRARETARPRAAGEPLHLALRPRPVGPAQPRHEARVPRVVQKPRMEAMPPGAAGVPLEHHRAHVGARAPRAARRPRPRTRSRGSG